MENIKGILISTLVPMSNHIANGGEKLLGNAASIKKRPDGRVYISGQMQRHALFSAIERINWTDSDRGETYVSNGDGTSNKIEVDLRADMGGFMHPSKGNYSGRREAPVSVTPAVALEESKIGRDLLLRIKQEDREHSLATNEFSQQDLMVMNFSLDLSRLSISKRFSYDKGEGENEGIHLDTDFIKHVSEDERRRRVKLLLEATRSLIDYANQARNAIAGEPQQALIVFDTKLSRKAARFFEAGEKERDNIKKELDQRGAELFIGNDLDGETSVFDAYSQAFDLLSSSSLFDPAGDDNIQTFAEVFEE